MALAHIFLPFFRLSTVSIMPPMLYTHSLVYSYVDWLSHSFTYPSILILSTLSLQRRYITYLNRYKLCIRTGAPCLSDILITLLRIVQWMTFILKTGLRYVKPYRLVNSYRSVEWSLFFHLTNQYEITSKKTWISTNTTVRISNLILFFVLFPFYYCTFLSVEVGKDSTHVSFYLLHISACSDENMHRPHTHTRTVSQKSMEFVVIYWSVLNDECFFNVTWNINPYVVFFPSPPVLRQWTRPFHMHTPTSLQAVCVWWWQREVWLFCVLVCEKNFTCL